jgi:hypothetical protein
MRRLVALVLVLVMLPILACDFSASVGDVGAGLETAVVCRDLADDYSPVGPTDVFGPGDDFYISVEYSDLEEGQTIEVKWYQADEMLYELSVDMDASTAGEGYAGFTLSNTQLWSAGDYHADIYLDGEFDHSVDFRVE